jgi:hypothetical protein
MMSAPVRSLALVAAAGGLAAGVATAAPAAAIPQCTNTGPTTTQCERPGNAQVSTAPPYNSYNDFPYGGFPWGGGGITISLGGLGG